MGNGGGLSAGAAALAVLIHDLIAGWDDPSVERLVFGTTDPARVAALADAFCREHLGAPIAAPLFYRSHVGAVFGAELEDGRQVVVKVHQQDLPAGYLAAVQRVQRHLAARGFPCTEPLLDPAPLAHGTATAERYLADGEFLNPHQPEVRQAIAALLARLVTLARSFAGDPELHVATSGQDLPPDVLWPRPHNAMFDFEGTAGGAEWIDALGWRARRILAQEASGDVVVGHCDWSAKHFRFVGGEVRVVYDWDSLRLAPEPVIVGQAAHAFTAAYETPWAGKIAMAPSYEEVLAFVTEYEAARGAPFTPAERRTCGAAWVYAMGYSSRCGHSRDPRPGRVDDFPPGSPREALATYGERLLERD